MLDASSEAKAVLRRKGGGKDDIAEQEGDGVEEPEGKSLFSEDSDDVVVMKRIEGFDIIKKE